MSNEVTGIDLPRLLDQIHASPISKPWHIKMVPENIVNLEVFSTPFDYSRAEITQHYNGKLIKTTYQYKRENFKDVLVSLGAEETLASLDFLNITPQIISDALKAIGLNITPESIEILGALEQLLILRCTNKSARFEGTVRLLRINSGDDTTVPDNETIYLRSQSGLVISSQKGDPIQLQG